MPEDRDAPDGIAEGVGRLLTEAEAEATLGRCGPNEERHKKGAPPECPVCEERLPNVHTVDKQSQICVCTDNRTGCTSTPVLDIGAGEFSTDIALGVAFPSAGAAPADSSKLYHRSMAPGTRRVFSTELYLEEDAGTSNITLYGRQGGKVYFTYSAGSYVPETGVFTTLTGSVGGPWTEEYPDGVKHVYEKLADGYGHIRKRYDRQGNAVYYEHDANGRQIAVKSSTGLGTYFEHDGSGNPIKVWDYMGRTAYLEYDGSDNLTRVKRPGSCESRFGYDAGRKITALEDADGFATYFEYGGDAYLDKLFREDRHTYYRYPNLGATAQVEDALNRTTYYVMDGSYNIKSVKNAAAEEKQQGWTGSFQRSRERDPLGNTTYLSYDAYGNVSRRDDPLGHAQEFDYSAKQELLRTTDALGHVREYAYDSSGNRTAEVDELGNVTYMVHDCAGLLTKRINALGQTEYWEYDGYGEQKSRKDARGNLTQLGYQWDNDGQGGRRESTVDADGKQSYFLFDACDRQVKAVDELGYYSESGYDGRGNRTVEIDKLGHPTYFTYNAFSELVRQHQEVSGQVEETVTYFDAAGQVERTYDAEGQASYFVHDAAGRQVQSSDALGRVTLAGYDAAGRQVRTVDPEGAVTYMLYDRASRQIGTAGPVAAPDVKSASLQEGVAGYTGAKDTYLYRSHSNSNFATAEELYVFRNTYRSLLKFAIFQSEGGPVPDGAMIVSALLSIYKYSNYPSLVSAYEVLKDWVDSEATWNRASNLEEWDVGGCQAPGDDCAAERVDWNVLSYTSDQWMKLDVTRSLLRWTSGMLANRGWVLDDWSPNDTVNYRRYRSSDYAADSSLRPKLEIIYVERGSYQELDANGRVTQAWSTGMGVAKTEFDAAGNATVRRDALNNATVMEYDPLNRQKKVIAADGGETETEFDAAGNQTKVTDALGNETRFGYDKLNRQVWQRDAAGYFTYFEYTARSEQSKVKNPRGAETKSYFDAAGRLSKQTDPVNVTTYFYQDEAGRTTKVHLAALDQVTYMAYDRAGRQTHTRTTPDGSTIYDTESVYDAAGQVERSVNPRGYATYFTHDQAGRQAGVKDALGNESQAAYDAAGNRTAAVSPRGHATYFGHDAANQLIQSVDPEGVAGYFGYDANGNRTAATVGTGAEARTTGFGYDQMNRLESVTAPDGGVTTFEFDLNGNRISERNPISNTTRYGYDERNLLVRVQDPLGQTAYYEHDEVGNLSRSTSPAGRIGNFAYDLADRRERAYYDDGFSAYFAHDAAGNMLRAQEATEGTVYFTHDRMNRVLSQKFAVGGAAYYAFDPNGNRTRLQYPSGGTAYFAFDEVDRMVEAKAPSGNAANFEFDASGNRTKSVWGNGAYTYYAHDKAERIESIRHFDDAGAALAYFEYGRDGRGNITSIGRLDGVTTYFGYDLADRLASEVWKDSGGAEIYAFAYNYDKAGNRISGTVLGENVVWEYKDAGAITRRVDDSGSSYYTHDLDGNLEVLQEAGGAVTYFEHGSHGLVTKIKPLGGTEVTFAYDGLLRRTRMVQGAVTTYFRHDGLNFIEIFDSTGSVTKLTHGYSEVDGIGSVVEVDVDGTLYYLHQDHRGTTEKVTDASGNVVWAGLCDAWGLPIFETGSNPTVFWYQGQAWWALGVNGRAYYVSPTRIYDAMDGRYLARDVIRGLAGGHDFAHNNPNRFVDPDGADPKSGAGGNGDTKAITYWADAGVAAPDFTFLAYEVYRRKPRTRYYVIHENGKRSMPAYRVELGTGYDDITRKSYHYVTLYISPDPNNQNKFTVRREKAATVFKQELRTYEPPAPSEPSTPSNPAHPQPEPSPGGEPESEEQSKVEQEVGGFLDYVAKACPSEGAGRECCEALRALFFEMARLSGFASGQIGEAAREAFRKCCNRVAQGEKDGDVLMRSFLLDFEKKLQSEQLKSFLKRWGLDKLSNLLFPATPIGG